METLRVTVKAPDTETAEALKESFFKKLYEHSGSQVIFELPLGADDEAEEIIAAAKKQDCEASMEVHKDELDDAAPVDFW